MSSTHLESLVGHREKHGRTRNRRPLVAAALTSSLILGVLLIVGVAHLHGRFTSFPAGLAARETSLAVRPDYPVSTFLYERGRLFRWFIGAAQQIVYNGFAIYGLYAACVAVTGAGAAACVAGAVGVVGTALGLIAAIRSGQVRTSDIELGNTNEVVRYGPGGTFPGKRDDEQDDRLMELMREVFGPDYSFEGYLDETDERHRDVIAISEGRPVRVHSFTSAMGTRFHHAMVFDHKRNGLFHRFGFAPADNATVATKRSTDVESSDEYFKSGGLDAFECAAETSSSEHLTASDAAQMTSLIECNVPDLSKVTELSLQVYDQTTMETIGAGRIAPFSSDAQSSVVSNDKGTGDCPASLQPENGCTTTESS